jgi:hypothetical protein
MTTSQLTPPRTSPAADPSPQERMVQLLAGFQVSQAHYTVAELDVASALLAGPRPVDDLAGEVRADPHALRRVLRSLTGLGLFTSAGPDRFAVTPLGATLAAGTPGSVRDLALTWMQTHYGPFGELLETVRSGVPAATGYYGRPFFAWLSERPEQVARFTGAMADLAAGIKAGAVAGYSLPGGRTVVDVGGADGVLLLSLLAADPDPERRGIVFDLPHVVPAARARVAEHPVADRVEVIAGDFFQSVPRGDTYFLSMILHDWDDRAATRILANLAAAGGPGARLVSLELIIPDDDAPHLSRMLDLTMLGMLTGRERTAAELTDLLSAGGFRLDRIRPGAGPMSVVEATAL